MECVNVPRVIWGNIVPRLFVIQIVKMGEIVQHRLFVHVPKVIRGDIVREVIKVFIFFPCENFYGTVANFHMGILLLFSQEYAPKNA
jgi:hypothetical protein